MNIHKTSWRRNASMHFLLLTVSLFLNYGMVVTNQYSFDIAHTIQAGVILVLSGSLYVEWRITTLGSLLADIRMTADAVSKTQNDIEVTYHKAQRLFLRTEIQEVQFQLMVGAVLTEEKISFEKTQKLRQQLKELHAREDLIPSG